MLRRLRQMSGPWGRGCRLLALLVVTVGPVMGLAGEPAGRPDGALIHREQPDDPPGPLPAEPPATLIIRRGPVIRGTFQSIQVNVDAFGQNIPGDAANEPSIAVDPTDPNNIVVGWRQFDTVSSNFRQAGWAYSHDGGQSWTFPGVLEPGVFRSDPVLDADADGNIYYYSLRGDFLCQMFKSLDGGVSWLPQVPAFGGDKNWFAIDRTGSIGHGHIYCNWSTAGSCCGNNTFTRSTDGGQTYLTPIVIPTTPVWGTIAVGPDGEMYVAGVDSPSVNNDNFRVAKSTNARDATVTPTFDFATPVDMGGAIGVAMMNSPNPAGLLGQVWVACDRSNGPTRGNVYMLCSVNPPGFEVLDVMFIRSTDGGLTWSPPVRVNDDPEGTNNVWQWFGTMSVAPSGRIDAIWNDTRADPTVTFSELYYASSTDAGQSWSQNVPISPPFNHHLGYPQQDKLGDYYDMVSDAVGARIAYAATFNGEQDVYFLRLAIDCDGNGIHDGDDIASGTLADNNGNGIPDVCETPLIGDFDGDGDVDLDDFGQFAECYNGASRPPAPGCPAGVDADLDGDGDVDLDDFAVFAANYTGGL